MKEEERGRGDTAVGSGLRRRFPKYCTHLVQGPLQPGCAALKERGHQEEGAGWHLAGAQPVKAEERKIKVQGIGDAPSH